MLPYGFFLFTPLYGLNRSPYSGMRFHLLKYVFTRCIFFKTSALYHECIINRRDHSSDTTEGLKTQYARSKFGK